ncbi:hypothetical protein ACHWQZ_G000093 [Mnemiopsis leidyi]
MDNRPSTRSYCSKRRQMGEFIEDYVNKLSNEECIDLYRLDKIGVDHICSRIGENMLIKRKTKAGLPVKVQVIVALRYFATGNSLQSLRDVAGLKLSRGSAHNCVINVSVALSSYVNEYVVYQWNAGSISSMKQGFDFPGVLGAIDCTKIKIKAPSVDEDAYVSRHPGHYLNCQVICDGNLKFVDVVAKWPGSVNDAVIWEYCGFKKQLEDFLGCLPKEYSGWLIGDSGYATKEGLLTPYLDCKSVAEEKYNKCHKRSRCKVERAIGVLKSRFQCLCKQNGGAIQFNESTACAIFVSCVILHNYCIDRNISEIDILPHVRREEEMWMENFSENNRRDHCFTDPKAGFDKRAKLTSDWF